MNEANPSAKRNATFVSGAILLAATLLEIPAMAHHPSVSAHDVGEAIVLISRISRLAADVHAFLMAMLLLVACGLWELAALRGLHRPLIRCAVLAYGVGVMFMLGAATVSGFLTGEVAEVLRRSTAGALTNEGLLLAFCRILNQSCAQIAVVAMSIGIGLWAIDLLRASGVVRLVGLLGVVGSLATIMGLLGGSLRLDVLGMSIVVLVQGVWNIAIALLLMRADRVALSVARTRSRP